MPAHLFPPLPLVPRPPRVWPVFVAAGAVLPVIVLVWIVGFVGWFIVHPPAGAMTARESQARVQEAVKHPEFVILILAAISLGNAGIALSGGWLSPLKPRCRLALAPGSAGWGALVLLVIGTLAAGLAAINFVSLIGIRANQGSSQLLNDMAKTGSPIQCATLLAVVSLFPAVCEELLFRGYVQTRLIARWGSIRGIAISAVMFGLIHMDLVQTPDMILLGSYLGWTAYRTGSTRTSMLCHLINNLVAIAVPLIGSKSGETDAPPTTTQMLLAITFGLIVCALCTWIANRLIPRPTTPDGKGEERQPILLGS